MSENDQHAILRTVQLRVLVNTLQTRALLIGWLTRGLRFTDTSGSITATLHTSSASGTRSSDGALREYGVISCFFVLAETHIVALGWTPISESHPFLGHSLSAFTFALSEFNWHAFREKVQHERRRLARQSTVALLHSCSAPPFEFAALLHSQLHDRSNSQCSQAGGTSISENRIRYLALKKLKRVNLFGTIKTKSALLDVQGTYFFVVEFVVKDAIKDYLHQDFKLVERFATVRILFEQRVNKNETPTACCAKSIQRVHHNLYPSKPYLFTNLDTKQIKFSSSLPDLNDPKSNIQKVLVFNLSDSEVHALSQDSLDSFILLKSKEIRGRSEEYPETFRYPESLPPASDPSQAQESTNSISSNLVTYQGKITEILDRTVGKYQLDGKHDLFLTGTPNSSYMEQFFMAGCIVTLHNIHLVVYESIDLTNFVSQEEKPTKRAVFIGCLQTTIELVEVPPEKNSPYFFYQTFDPAKNNSIDHERQKHERKALRHKWGNLNLIDLTLLDEIFNILQSILNTSTISSSTHISSSAAFALSKKILKRYAKKTCPSILESANTISAPKLAHIFCHDIFCTDSSLRYPHPYLVSISQVLHSDDSIIGDFVMSIVQSSSRSSLNRCDAGPGNLYIFRVFNVIELFGSADCFLVGRVYSRGGSLWFYEGLDYTNDESCVLVQILGDGFETAGLQGDVLVVYAFRVVVEVYGAWFDNDSSQVPLVKKYLQIRSQDCEIDEVLEENGMQTVSVDAGMGMLYRSVFRVDYKGALTVRFGRDGSLEVCGRMCGVFWKMSEEEKVRKGSCVAMNAFHDAICLVNGKSLDLWNSFRVGGHYLLCNIDTEYYSKSSSDVSRQDIVRISLSETTKSLRITQAALKSPSVTSSVLDFTIFPPILSTLLQDSPLHSKPLTIKATLTLIAKANLPPKQMYPKLLTIEGIIVSKSLSSTKPWALHALLPAQDLFSKHGVGTGRFDRIIVLKLVDDIRQNSASVDIYLDVRNQVVPLGVVPGAKVRVYRTGFKVATASRSVYALGLCETSIEVLSAFDGGGDGVSQKGDIGNECDPLGLSMQLQQLPRLWLVHLYSVPISLKLSSFCLRCVIQHVEEVVVWCDCWVCGSKISGADGICMNLCRTIDGSDADKRLRGRAKLHIDDGSCEAVVLIEGADAVLNLLRIESVSKRKEMQELVGACGTEIMYQRPPPWFDTDDIPGTVCGDGDAIIPESQRQQLKIQSAQKLLHKYAVAISLTSTVLIACRQLFSPWNNYNPDEKETFDYDEVVLNDLSEISKLKLYSRIGVHDLTRRNVKLFDKSMAPVLAPPRIVLHGYYLEHVNPVFESTRLLQER